ncbi:MAG: 4-hydroxybenzoate 3-monooxygenase [Hyphomicrobiaceae bacterium]
MRHTQVGIVGAGPAGLLLARLLHLAGIECLILEQRDRAYVEGRIRAGVLEQGTVDVLRAAQVADRLDEIGLTHNGINLSLNGHRSYVDLKTLSGGKTLTVYGQTEVTKDLITANLDAGVEIVFEAKGVDVHDIAGARPRLTYTNAGMDDELKCDYIAGCDGFHGVCRARFPNDQIRLYDRTYPFAWLGILAESPPVNEELVYARHDNGFALYSMRSPTLARNYIQCHPDADLADWPDERVWDELRIRLGPDYADDLEVGAVVEKSITPMRSFVAEPLRFGRVFLAGDSGHIVPPTGAKGLNLAVSDVHYLAEALKHFYATGEERLLDDYSDLALARVWKSQRFSWWMTSLLHCFPEDNAFDDRVRQTDLSYVLGSVAAQTMLAENYVGLPF